MCLHVRVCVCTCVYVVRLWRNWKSYVPTQETVYDRHIRTYSMNLNETKSNSYFTLLYTFCRPCVSLVSYLQLIFIHWSTPGSSNIERIPVIPSSTDSVLILDVLLRVKLEEIWFNRVINRRERTQLKDMYFPNGRVHSTFVEFPIFVTLTIEVVGIQDYLWRTINIPKS